jgi:hypothetical protein
MKRLLIPVVQQSSTSSSGAASLSSVCLGFGMTATEADIFSTCAGTAAGVCVDELEAEANRLGLACEQLVVPVDHLFQPNSYVPSIVVTRSDDGCLGSVVLWQQLCGFVQVMDPQIGRRWVRRNTLLDSLYRHTQPVSARSLSEWMRTPSFQEPLRTRIKRLRIPDTQTLIANAACEPGWQGVATLDAAVRQVASQSDRRRWTGRANRSTVVRNWKAALLSPEVIPEEFWFVRRRRRVDVSGSDTVWIDGAVVLRIRPRVG